MKQLNITFLLVVLMSITASKALAHDIEVKNADGVTIYYNFINNNTELGVTSSANKYTANVVIPSSVVYENKTYPVTSIGNSAFYGCSGLTSVTIPNSVTSIGDNAFYNCSGLTSVTIPNSVTSIGSSAFLGCSGLTSVTIPNSVTSIGDNAFYGCSGLTSITIPNSVTSIGSSAFYDTTWYNNQPDGLVYAGKVAYKYKGTMPANNVISILEGTLGIAGSAFYNCSGLTSVTIPNSVTSIGSSAFYSCFRLTSVTIPNSVTSIGERAFYQCIGLTSVTIPNSVTSIGAGVFSGCSGLTSITIPNSVTSIGSSAFYNCSGLTSVTIPNSVTSIGSSAFYNCSGFTSVTIPNSVTSIGESAFSGCYRLNTINCLNPTPPTCGSKIFYVDTSSSSSVRDRYDVYSYANLHVPMGSEELYGAAYEWRYFNKIKEDMEQDGKIYYANLTVKQGTTGYTRQAIKAAEKYTLYIGSIGNNTVNSVLFNGTDVTDQVVDGYFTTPEIKGESVLSISYEVVSDVKSTTLNQVKVTGYNDNINVSQIEESADVSVYTLDGKLVNSIPSVLGSTSIPVSPDQVYIVKVGARTYKIAL